MELHRTHGHLTAFATEGVLALANFSALAAKLSGTVL